MFKAHTIQSSLVNFINANIHFFPAHSQVKQVLYIVEGLSAAHAVCRVRDAHQAVFAMQGKPKNTFRSALHELHGNDSFAGLIDVLGAGCGDGFALHALKFHKLVLLMDPNGDGMHCVMLMLLFFKRWMPQLLQGGRLLFAKAPFGALTDVDGELVKLAWDGVAFDGFVALQQGGAEKSQLTRYAGVASIPSSVLYQACLDERVARRVVLTEVDALNAVNLLG